MLNWHPRWTTITWVGLSEEQLRPSQLPRNHWRTNCAFVTQRKPMAHRLGDTRVGMFSLTGYCVSMTLVDKNTFVKRWPYRTQRHVTFLRNAN